MKYHHHEVGGASQQEIETSFSPLLEMADKSQLAKYIIKNAASRFGKSASFMPKPLFMEPGSGLHVHQFLAKEGKSVFYNENMPLHLSEVARFYLGGLLKHAPALMAFTNPSTNPYTKPSPPPTPRPPRSYHTWWHSRRLPDLWWRKYGKSVNRPMD